MRRPSIAAALITLSVSAALAQAPAQAPSNPLRRPAPAASAPAAPAPAAAEAPTPRRATRAARAASTGDFKARRKRCSEDWRAAKAANTTAGQKWPQFWSACNTRLKAAGV
jgi:hypothetical protein